MQVVLASSSPRRRSLLAMLVQDFAVSNPDIDETPVKEESPGQYVSRLAAEKARCCASADKVILGADTTVVCQDQILGKPTDVAEARRLLNLLSGNTHTVFTAVAMVVGTQVLSRLTATCVTFTTLAPEAIEAYLQTDEPWDKAGAYGIQGYAGAFVEKIEGSYSGVVGLPLCETRQLLADAGVTLRHG